MTGSREPTSRLRPRWWRRWTLEIVTRLATRLQLRFTRETSQHVIGLSEREQQLVHLCGLVHDIGKIGLPAGLLEKPGALTLEERRQMEEHRCRLENGFCRKVDDYAEIASIVKHHHERVDGLGYPDRLAGCGDPVAVTDYCRG